MIKECQICHLPLIWNGRVIAVRPDTVWYNTNYPYSVMMLQYGHGWLCSCPTPRVRVKVDMSNWRGIEGSV